MANSASYDLGAWIALGVSVMSIFGCCVAGVWLIQWGFRVRDKARRRL